jgi:hypothetical protein
VAELINNPKDELLLSVQCEIEERQAAEAGLEKARKVAALLQQAQELQ